jgi:hypothetical protein
MGRRFLFLGVLLCAGCQWILGIHPVPTPEVEGVDAGTPIDATGVDVGTPVDATAGDVLAPLDAGPDATEAGTVDATFTDAFVDSAAVPTASVEGRVFLDNPAVPIPGTAVRLLEEASGTEVVVGTALTDANGVYAFVDVAPGSYRVAFAPSLDPSVPSPTYTTTPAQPFAVDAATVTVNATCPASSPSSCVVGPDVLDPFHQLVIVDPSVTNPALNAEASNAVDGHLSFRHVVEVLAGCPGGPGNTPCVSAFIKGWIDELGTPQGVDNGSGTTYGVARRETSFLVWPADAYFPSQLDLAQTPFQLLAVVNRTDLGSNGPGQVRLIYGYVPNQFSVELDFALPPTADLPDRAAWVRAFHDLPDGGLDAGVAISDGATCGFACRVTSLVDRFVDPANFIALRTNDFTLAPPGVPPPWAWRRFTLSVATGQNAFMTAPTPETPDDTLQDSGTVAAFLIDNAAEVRNGLVALPRVFVGGEAFAVTKLSWGFPSVDAPTLRSFSGRTCNGCHVFVADDPNNPLSQGPWFHVDPTKDADSTGENLLSGYVAQIEVPRRAIFMRRWLACDGSAAACPAPVDIELTQF